MGNDTVSCGQGHFQRIESCLDYQAYTYRIDPGIPASHYTVICQRLAALGQANEERMGVVYIYAPWGFCIVPGYGFPEIRLNFYKEIPINEIQEVLALICAIFETSDTTVNSGDVHA